MKKAFDLTENLINFLGVGFALTDVNSIINLILLIVSILAIVIRSAFEIRDHIIKKEYDKIDDTINDAVSDIEDKLPKDKEEK